MSFKLGNTNIGELYVGSNKIALAYLGSNLVYKASAPVDPYNPLNLPPNTVRVRTNDGKVPERTMLYGDTSYETATLVSGTTDVYDVYKTGTDFRNLLYMSSNVVEVLGANTSNVTDMGSMFAGCSRLSTVPLFDTSNVTDMGSMFAGCSRLSTVPLFDTSNVTYMVGMFEYCSSLTTIPLFDTSKVTIMSLMFHQCESLTTVPLFDTSNVNYMNDMFLECHSLATVPLFNTSKVIRMSQAFYNCYKVESGALALYRQASTQANPPIDHEQTFFKCGSDTPTGAAELAQIPSDWK